LKGFCKKSDKGRNATVKERVKPNRTRLLTVAFLPKTFFMSKYENFDEQKQFACRVIADHARSTAFAIADGILPGNEGRNYVLRKIMRRAIYHGREHLGFDKLFFHQVCGFVVEQMKDAYPELAVQKDFIDKMVRLEEERFGNTMTVGLKKLNELLGADSFKRIDSNTVGSNVSFTELAKLYDTFGVPIDLIYVVVEEDWHKKTGNNQYLTSEEFTETIQNKIKELQANSEIGKTKQAEKINPIYAALQRRSDVRTEFVGYDATSVSEAKVVALVKDNEQVNELNVGEEGLIILDKTPFYAESGGQVGDVGMFVSSPSVNEGSGVGALPNGRATDTIANVRIFDTFAPVKEYVLHKSKIESGTIKVGDVVSTNVDVEKRDATRRNHTATHLAHSALREVLGTHVKQAGSVVAPTYLRFDFTHYQPLSAVEINEIEDLVNYQILQNSKVNTDLMSIDEAMRTGAMALFGEKYGEKVRVLSVGNGEFSRELCGGTHVNATGDIGSFKITADEAIASGVRRIRAITGFDSFERFREAELLIANSLNVLNTQRDNLPAAIAKLQEELKKTRKEIDDLKMKIATGAIGGSSSDDEAKEVNGVKVIAKIVEGLDKGGMRHLSDSLMAKIKSGVVIIAKTEDDKVSFIVRVSDDLTKQISAGNIVREIAPIVNGRGGGKADMAEGGGTDASKLNEAIEASYSVIEKMLN
jgi:alanyl-tRNA synthetase